MSEYKSKFPDTQYFAGHTPQNVYPDTKHTDQTPQLLTKKWLADHFGFRRPSGAVYYKGLYKHVLTADVLQSAGLDIQSVRNRSLKTFDRTASLRLIHILGL